MNPYEPPNSRDNKRPTSVPIPFVIVMLVFAGLGLSYVAVLYRHPLLDEFSAFLPVAIGIVAYGLIAFFCGWRSRTAPGSAEGGGLTNGSEKA